MQNTTQPFQKCSDGHYEFHSLPLCLVMTLFFFGSPLILSFHLVLCSVRGARVKPERESDTQGGKPERNGTMESILSEQSATVDELVEACIQAFGWSFERYFFIVLFQSESIKSNEVNRYRNVWCCAHWWSGNDSHTDCQNRWQQVMFALWHGTSSRWWVTPCFLLADEKGTLKDASLVRMFLMMQPWYIPSTDMAKKLVLKYPSSLFPAASGMCHAFLCVFVYKCLFAGCWPTNGIEASRGLDEEQFLVCF